MTSMAEQVLTEVLSEKGRKSMDMCNEVIALMENANEREQLEIIASLSSAYSSVKAGFVVTGIMAGLGEEYVLSLLLKIDATEVESFRALMQIVSAYGQIPNPLAGSTDTIQ